MIYGDSSVDLERRIKDVSIHLCGSSKKEEVGEMEVKFKVGGEFFDSLRKSQCYYVDKTKLIYDLVTSENAVTLFTRPRRFGN